MVYQETFFAFIEDNLFNKRQRVVINGVASLLYHDHGLTVLGLINRRRPSFLNPITRKTFGNYLGHEIIELTNKLVGILKHI